MEAKAFEVKRGSPRTQKHDVGQVIFDGNCDFVPVIVENNSLTAETTKDRRNRKKKLVVFHVELTELFLVCRRNNICRIFNVFVLRKWVFLDKTSCCSSWKLWEFASLSHFFSEQMFTIHWPLPLNSAITENTSRCLNYWFLPWWLRFCTFFNRKIEIRKRNTGL